VSRRMRHNDPDWLILLTHSLQPRLESNFYLEFQGVRKAGDIILNDKG
jgi:hypothetical protein